MDYWRRFLQLIAVISLLDGVSRVYGAKILAIFPFPGPSQYLVVQPYLKTLASRGHEVTVINAYPQKKPIKKYRDIEVPEVFKYSGDWFSYMDVRTNKIKEILDFSWYYSSIAKDVMDSVNVQRLLKSPEEHFDLLIVEVLQTDIFYGLAEHFKAPMIGFSSYGTDPYIDALVDNISPMAYSPLFSGNSMERMDFWQRLENMWHNLLMLGHRVLVHNPLHDRLYREYFPNATRSLEEMRQNISLILLNQHYSLSFPRPYVTNMIEVGGFHLQHQPQDLPQDIEDFIANSQQDVIYFSMGSNIKSENFPEPKRKIILETFSQLPYKVLWKFENPSLMTDKPANVFISKWFPQGDILSHPKVKLFISHGGLLSLTESIYHGKPILGMPIFFDQHRNIKRATQYGLAVSVDYKTLNATGFLDSIREIMENPKYLQKAQDLSRRYRDQPIDPLEKAIYWTEFVMRHHGAPFLRSPAQYLNFWQKQSWDCAALLFVCFCLGLIVFVKLCKSIFILLENILFKKKSKND
ncbi:UDP-glucosyltransferase 2-like [Musca autumnalis]|uniref:UDP-glucosyltransferase 2-like n=1 Tax=Musca autumnalis TaxID=221902 RepID=UPI003CE829C4